MKKLIMLIAAISLLPAYIFAAGSSNTEFSTDGDIYEKLDKTLNNTKKSVKEFPDKLGEKILEVPENIYTKIRKAEEDRAKKYLNDICEGNEELVNELYVILEAQYTHILPAAINDNIETNVEGYRGGSAYSGYYTMKGGKVHLVSTREKPLPLLRKDLFRCYPKGVWMIDWSNEKDNYPIEYKEKYYSWVYVEEPSFEDGAYVYARIIRDELNLSDDDDPAFAYSIGSVDLYLVMPDESEQKYKGWLIGNYIGNTYKTYPIDNGDLRNSFDKTFFDTREAAEKTRNKVLKEMSREKHREELLKDLGINTSDIKDIGRALKIKRIMIDNQIRFALFTPDILLYNALTGKRARKETMEISGSGIRSFDRGC